MFILSLGLLGVAALIPVGKLALVETDKSDRGSACGRAGLCHIEARRMLAAANWYDPLGPGGSWTGPLVLDPLGVTSNVNASLTMNLGGTRLGKPGNYFPLPRFSAALPQPNGGTPVPLAFLGGDSTAVKLLKQTAADQMFRWRDDVTLVRQQDWTPPPAPPNGNRPSGMFAHLNGNGQTTVNASPTPAANDAAVLPASNGAFSWFATVSPSAATGQLPRVGGRLLRTAADEHARQQWKLPARRRAGDRPL